MGPEASALDRVHYLKDYFTPISIASDRSRGRHLSGLGLGPPPSPSLSLSLLLHFSLLLYFPRYPSSVLGSFSFSLFSFLRPGKFYQNNLQHSKLIFTTSFLHHIVTTVVSQKSPLTRSIYIQVPTGFPSPSLNLR